MTHLILIDSRVPGIEDILSSLTPNTESLVFDYSADTLEDFQSRIQKPYSSVAIAQHNYGLPYFNFLLSMGTCYVKDVATIDPELEGWSDFIALLQWLKQNGASCVDFLACNLWESPDWVYAIGQLRTRLDLTIRASIDITGVDGNFVLESDNFNMVEYYFTEEILKYKYNFYTNAAPDDLQGYYGYTPIFFPASSPGYISATAYKSILGGTLTAPNFPLTADISNVATICMTRSAVAVLKTDGTVVSFGNRYYGGNSAPVASQLYNITKLLSTQYWFTALRSDGRVFSWGGGGIIPGQTDINYATNGVESVLLSDVSNSLVDIVDIFTSSTSSFALTPSGGLLAWGTNECRFSRNAIFSSGVVKVLAGAGYISVFKNTGVVYQCSGNSYWDSNGGFYDAGSYSPGTTSNTNPIVDAYRANGPLSISIRTTPSNTTQIANLIGSIIYYTMPAGVTVSRVQYGYISNYFFLLSNNVLVNVSYNGTYSTINNVTDIATNSGAYAYLQNNVVVVVGNAGLGGNLTHATFGVPSGKNLTNVRRLVSSGRSLGALKFDNTFVWWGSLDSYTSVSFPGAQPTLNTAISSNIASVYGSDAGYVFTKLDGSIIQIGSYDWAYEGAGKTTMYGAKRAGKNVLFVPNMLGFFAVENTPTTSNSMSQYVQYSPTTVTYYNNNPDYMAIKGRKYSVMVGTSVAGTWVCPADSFTYTFTNVVFNQGGDITVSICDTPHLTTSYSVMGSFNATIAENPNISPADPPTITSVAIGPQQLTVNFTAPSWNGGLPIIGYKYSINGGVTYTTLPSTSTQFVLTGLTGSNYTIWLVTTTYAGDSNYSEYNALLYNVPSATTISSVTLGNQQVVLNVSTASNGGGAITGYKYAFSANGTYTSFPVNAGGGVTGATSYTITGLLNFTPYTLYVKSTNGAGDSTTATTYGPFTLAKTAPNAPTVNSVVAMNSSVQVTFTAPYNGGEAITSYSYTLNNGTAVSVGLVNNPFIINGLTNGTSYAVKMLATNATGTSSASSSAVSATPLTLPGAPTIGTITVGNQQASVAFTAPASNGGSAITQYKYRLDNGSYVTLPGLSSPFTITGLTNGTSYGLVMTTVNAAGESVASSSVSFTPAIGPSTPVIQSITASNQSISVSFTANNGGSELTGLQYYLNDASMGVTIATTTSPLVISGLTNGTAYRVKFSVSNAKGTSSVSLNSSYATPITVPDAPTIESITSGNQYVQFTFSDPLSNGSSAITGYKYSLNGGAYVAVGLVQSPYRISQNISNGTEYKVQLIATNAAGDSVASSESSPVIPCRVPDVPTIVSVQNGDQSATVQISSGFNGGSEILSYTYTFGQGEPVVITSLSSPLIFSNLTVGTVYPFQLKATNIVGDSPSATVNVTGMSTPEAPVIVGATAGNKSIIVEFSVPNANSSPITGYKYSIANGVYLSAILSDPTHITITGLTENIEYNVVIAAVNAIGQSADSNSSSATPYTYPLAPTIDNITVDNGSASVEFTAQSNNGSVITEYMYSLNNGNYITYPSVESPLELSDLSNGVAYTIKMKAVNAAGASVLASSASFMPRTVPEKPTITSVTAGNQSCEVEFEPGFFNGSTITKYRYSFNGTEFQDANGTVSPITIEGLVNGDTYMIYLLAVNAVGESTISSASSSFVPFVTQSTPNPPVDLSVIAGDASVTVHFTDGVNLGSAIKGYMYSVDGGATRFWAKQMESPLIIDGLDNGVAKTVKLCAVNNSGPSELSSASELFTPCAKPDSPILTGVQSADQSIVVSFVPGSDNGSEIIYYEYSIDASNTYWVLDADSTIRGLTNGTAYRVKIRAVNSIGTSLPSLTSAYVTPHSVPSVPTINSVVAGEKSITISFTPGNANGSVISRYEYAFVTDDVTGDFSIASSTGSPIVINGLENGTSYRVVLRALSSLGEYSAASPVSNAVIPGAVPTKPLITKIQPGNGSITVNWTTSNTNGSAITSVLYNLSGGTYINAGTTDASFSITGLTNGSEYTVSVIAVNSFGQSLPSSVSEVVSPLSNPSPPTITSVLPGDSKVQIALTPGNTNGSSFIGYKYALDGTLYRWANENTSPITIYGLVNGTSYNISLQSVGETVGASIPVLISSVMPYRSPDPPVIKSVVVGNGSAVITFVDGSSNGLTMTGYKYSLDAINYMDVSAVSNTITLTGLTNGTSYTVSLKSVSTIVNSPASVLSAPFTPYTNPSPPVISKVVTGNQTASVYFTDGAANGSGATLAYQYTFDGSNTYWASSAVSPIVISSGLSNSQGYKIRVATKTELGMSAFSSQSTTFIPYTLPNPPTITSVVAGNGSASLNFTDGSNNGRPITSYQYTINGNTYSASGPSPLSLTGLTNGTSYTVTMTGMNLAGYSQASNPSTFMPFAVPSAPTITNLVPSANQLTVYLSPGNANGSVITKYYYSLIVGGVAGSYVSTDSSALSFVITGLTNGTSYTMTVKAENAAGVGSASSVSTAAIPFTVPDAPTITGVTVGNGSATVAITNGNNNGRTATQYQYTYTTGGVSTTLTTSTSATQLSTILITGLTNWTTYTVSVKAINIAGMSSASTVSASFMPYTIPGSPVIASVVPGNQTITVSLDPATIGTGVVGYKYSFDNSNNTYVAGSATTFTITGLTNATSYNVYVKSVTSQGDSAVSSPSSAVVPFSVPNAPTITSIVSGNKTISIYVSDGSNNGRSITSYEYSTDGEKYTDVEPVSPIVLNNLTNWQSYSYYVRTVNVAGSSLPSAKSSEVVPFLVPTSASIANIVPGDCQLTVEMDGWTSDAGIIGYKYLLDNSGDLVYVPGAAASFVITGLVNGQDYVVQVKSCTTAGESPLSNPSLPKHPCAPPNPPTNVVVTPLNESAVITFTDGSANGESIQYYMYSLSGGIDTPVQKRADGTLKIFGISNAVDYTIRLRAVNNAGVSNYSEVSNIFMPFGVPLVPPVITKILPGNACVYVHFSEADTNGATLTKFRWTDGTKTFDVTGTTSPLTISGLINKKAVSISIASCNLVGVSPFTTARSIIPGVPLAPVITDVVAGPAKLLVYFDVPEDNGFGITSYLYGFVGAPAFVKGNSANTTSASPLQILGLKNGTSYNPVIMASNLNGNSAVSNSIGPRIPCAPPAKVSIATVSSLIDGALVTFTKPLDNGTPLLKYKYALNSSTTYADASGLTIPLRVYGISPNTVNTIKIIATNAAGDSVESTPSKPFTYVYLPPAQVKVTALTIALNQLTVAFAPPTMNGSPIIGYKYALNDSTTFLDASGISLPLVIRDGILPNVNYNVRIIAVNGAGSSVPSLPVAKPVSFVYLPPLAPTITSIVPGDRSALVAFAVTPARGAPITGYAYTLDASATTIYDVNGTVPSLTINELTNDTLYNVRVAAITPAGYSAWSVAKPVTPVYKVPDKPLIAIVTAGNGQLTVIFTAPAANGSPITSYSYTLNGGSKVELPLTSIVGGKTFVITGLTNGTLYNVQMCATNLLGDSDISLGKAGTPKA